MFPFVRARPAAPMRWKSEFPFVRLQWIWKSSCRAPVSAGTFLEAAKERDGRRIFLRSLETAAAEMGNVSEEDILQTLRETREMLARRKRRPVPDTLSQSKQSMKQSPDEVPGPRKPSSTRKKLPEITLVDRTKTKTA